MRWFRSNIRGGSRLALFALAVQLVLTFGHVHLGNLAPAAAKVALSALLTDRGGAATPSGDDQRQKSPRSSDFDCPICALIQLAGASAPAMAPALPLPATLGGPAFVAPDQSAPTGAPYFAFQARGPPAV